MIGFFGIPDAPASTSTKTHFVEGEPGHETPICGSRIGPTMEFQWCSYIRDEKWVECKRCMAIHAQQKSMVGHGDATPEMK